MKTASFDGLNRYIIPDYTEKRPFSSFLPGIAGADGVPMWVFYVNRGQGITSFGVESKDHPIMEFQPANKAYLLTPHTGFRTFIKFHQPDGIVHYEPFAALSDPGVSRSMFIGLNELEIQEIHPQHEVQVNVRYFTLTGEPFAGLVRQVSVTNKSRNSLSFEMLDGMPALIPYGADNWGLKTIGRTLEAWMEVTNLETRIPFFRLKATAGDTSEVSEIQAGHFALAYQDMDRAPELLPTLIDPEIIFGQNTALSMPDGFLAASLESIVDLTQVSSGKTPCAFFGMANDLNPGENVSLNAVYGHVNGIENLLREVPRLVSPGYLAGKRADAFQVAQTLTEAVHTRTASPLFDAYVSQTFLDNVMRGGWPVFLGGVNNQHVYHIYSRKHGDLERDYNDFFLAAEFYSYGNGNYRDVNQNRRSDVRIDPRVGDHNIRDFLSLIQLDGYNPLVVKGTRFSLSPEARGQFLKMFSRPEEIAPILDSSFSPGELLKFITDHKIGLSISLEDFLSQVMDGAEAHLEADFGEGYWIDHWTYLLDLIESYLAIFPERKQRLLFETVDIPFYQSPAQVRPRSEKYVLSENGARQYHAVEHVGAGGWVQTPAGETCFTSVFGKLVLLAGIKFGTLDPEGMGIEMEAGRPGWYDALNGLPGLFGSSMPETYELLRLIRFLREAIAEASPEVSIALPEEYAAYLESLQTLTATESNPFSWWEAANNLREAYRAKVYTGLSGVERSFSGSMLDGVFHLFEQRIQEGIARAAQYSRDGLTPTYFRREAKAYEILQDKNGSPKLDEAGRPRIRVKQFQSSPLPPFLEGAVRAMKVSDSIEHSRAIHARVQASPLFDRKLNMYKVNAPLDEEPHEIGRARAFTPGWLENESIWLHMEYKYLLELLKAGMFDVFWQTARDTLIPFLDPERYGRSPLENSSFLVSSAHPDERLHGGGFVARLSGSTAEFLHMWTVMMAGEQPFSLMNGELVLALRPALPGWLFPENGLLTFKFLNHTLVKYQNPALLDTWRLSIKGYTLKLKTGQAVEIEGPFIPSPFAGQIRSGDGMEIAVYFQSHDKRGGQ